ncbi:c-type cytochrome [Bradyrhizobium sp. WYCCWR 12699]|uniref:c-type cytochrome n=1 Tax=Bradyrhizobium sp. WYCCWR 12699 TaxID=3064203 RepID=UPI0028A319A1|nr:c-type cytochrome [Bradyrhizobium sp. WYCCWR 12699]MDT4739910.1 c-type cytochrome [Bradyrhizobium sp. WYCCWR 12699]
MRFTHPRWASLAVATASLLVAAAVVTGFARSERQQNEAIAGAMSGGDPARAPDLIRRYGCAGCHTISGIPGGDGKVGGSLDGLRGRVYVAGVASNTPDNLVQWIVKPQAFSPRSAMPATGITEAEARDVAAYLYAQ